MRAHVQEDESDPLHIGVPPIGFSGRDAWYGHATSCSRVENQKGRTRHNEHGRAGCVKIRTACRAVPWSCCLRACCCCSRGRQTDGRELCFPATPRRPYRTVPTPVAGRLWHVPCVVTICHATHRLAMHRRVRIIGDLLDRVHARPDGANPKMPS